METFGSQTISINIILHFLELVAVRGAVSVAIAGMLFCAAVILHSLGVLDAIGLEAALDLIPLF